MSEATLLQIIFIHLQTSSSLINQSIQATSAVSKLNLSLVKYLILTKHNHFKPSSNSSLFHQFFFFNQILSFILFFLGSSGHPGRAGKYWLFATHWGFILIVVAFNLDAILVLARYIIQVRLSQLVINNTH